MDAIRIEFLLHSAYGIGGTTRATLNLAAALAARGHAVEIVSVVRRLDRPAFGLPPGVALTPLVDLRRWRRDRFRQRRRQPSELVPTAEEFYGRYSRLTDERIVDRLRGTDADVVVGTRPALNLLVARYAPAGSVRIAQEHMTQDLIPPLVKAAMRAAYPRLHACLTLTKADAAALRRDVDVAGPVVTVLPNAVPAPAVPPARGDSRTVVAAGRLQPVKRFDLLVEAFGRVVAEHPDWRLRIYGTGPEAERLRRQVAAGGLREHVRLMGGRAGMAAEWARGAIAAVTSDRESFGMSLVEAMRCGLPVVSTACPAGPPEIVTDGVDGLLCPVGDAGAVAAALHRLIADPARRRAMAAAALASSARFDPAVVAERFERVVRAVSRAGLTTV